MKILLLITTGALLLNCVFTATETFHYSNVENWDILFPDYCDGSRQSPIDIDTDDTEYGDFDDLVLTGYGDTTGVTQALYKNSHTLQLTLDGNNYTISGGGLDYTYNAAQLHFHWGSVSTQGSEHTVNQVKYAAEMHIVHVQDGLSLSEAIADSSGLAVLGVLIEESDDDNENFAPLVELAAELDGTDSEYLNTTIVLEDILPSSPEMFYRYEGSLTTPSCNEAVIWTVFKNKISLSSDQLDVFRALTDDDGNVIQDNYRPTQPRNNRVVYDSFSNGNSVTVSVITLLASGVIMRILM